MSEKTRILLLSANPLPTSRILVDLETKEIVGKLEEGPCRTKFELQKCEATQPIDIQKLLLKHQPHIVHFCGHGHKKQKIILGGALGRAKTVDNQGLAKIFTLYNQHLRLVVLNACYTDALARSIAETVDYAVGTSKGIGDKAAVAFAGAFYRALGFGKSVRHAFESAKAELALTKTPRSRGIELFVKSGVGENDSFPHINENRNLPRRLKHAAEVQRIETKFECHITVSKTIQQTVFTQLGS